MSACIVFSYILTLKLIILIIEMSELLVILWYIHYINFLILAFSQTKYCSIKSFIHTCRFLPLSGIKVTEIRWMNHKWFQRSYRWRMVCHQWSLFPTRRRSILGHDCRLAWASARDRLLSLSTLRYAPLHLHVQSHSFLSWSYFLIYTYYQVQDERCSYQ